MRARAMSAWRKPAAVAFALVFVVGACTNSKPQSKTSPSASTSSSDNSNPTDLWGAFRARPLKLPTGGSHACMRARTKTVSKGFGPALQPVKGPAIVMPVGFTSDGRLDWVFNRKTGGTIWGGQKVLWVVSPRYPGAVLIRGHRLDGTGEIRFGDGPFPAAYLQLDLGSGAASQTPWRDFPSYTRVSTSGCYAYQVDGNGFSEVIAFKAVHDAAGDVK